MADEEAPPPGAAAPPPYADAESTAMSKPLLTGEADNDQAGGCWYAWAVWDLLVLIASQDDDGKWELDDTGHLFQLIDHHSNPVSPAGSADEAMQENRELTLEEISNALEDTEGAVYKEIIDSNSRVLKALLNKKAREAAFKKLDKNQDNHISMREWGYFMTSLRRGRLRFYEEKAHLTYVTYWGKGDCGLSDGSDGCCVSDWSAWWADYCYYVCNAHPLLSIFLVDRDHPLERAERVMMEFITMSFSLMMSGMHDWQPLPDGKVGDAFSQKTVYSIVFITIPGMILYQIVLFLYTCPLKTCHRDRTAASVAAIEYMDHCNKVGKWVALIFVFGGCVCFIVGMLEYFNYNVDSNLLIVFLQGRLQGYVLFFITTLALQFNPLVAITLSICGYPLYSVGNWTLERRKVMQSASGDGIMSDVKQRGIAAINITNQEAGFHKTAADFARDDIVVHDKYGKGKVISVHPSGRGRGRIRCIFDWQPVGPSDYMVWLGKKCACANAYEKDISCDARCLAQGTVQPFHMSPSGKVAAGAAAVECAA